MKVSASREAKDRGRPRVANGDPGEKPSSRRSTVDPKLTVEGRTKSASGRLDAPPLCSKGSYDASATTVEERTKSATRLNSRNSYDSRMDPVRPKSNSRPSSVVRRNSTSQAVPTTFPVSRRVPMRSASVTSNYSTTSTYDSTMADTGGHYSEMADMRRRLQDAVTERDSVKRELSSKKEEILGLRDKLLVLKRELSEVNTSKGALNEACVSGMMDAFALNSKIAELEATRDILEQENLQLRHDAQEYDRERRGLLDLLDDSKQRLQELEKLLEMEVERSKELESARAAATAQMGMELKWARRELAEKTLRIKKHARTNTKLACRLLALEAQGAEADNLAKTLQSENMQLAGDNKELAESVLQLGSQIDQMENERCVKGGDLRTQQRSARLEEDLAMVLNGILTIEEEIELTRKEVANGQKTEADLQCLLEDKAELQSRVSLLSRDIEAIKEESKLQDEAQEQLREEYVERLEADLVAAKTRIDELSKLLKGARASETENISSQAMASEEITRLESEKADLKEEMLLLQAQLKQTQDEMQNQAHIIREDKEREIQDLQADRERLEKMVQSLDKQLTEYQRVKLETDKAVRKLKQDSRELDQQKENLAYQVNVLEWQLVGLYSEKEDALRTLADRDMDIMRITQELEDKEDDIEHLRQDISEENEAQIEACELRYEKEQLEDALEQKQRYIMALERELEQLKKDKTLVDAHVKDQHQKQRPWFAFQVKF